MMKSVCRFCFMNLLVIGFLATQSMAFDLDTDIEDASITYLGAYSYGYTGWSLSSGDVDGDGLTDLLIGCAGSKVYLILGKSMGQTTGSNIESYADASFSRETSVAYDFGRQVSMTGDVNNDGYDDILIGSPRIGKAYLILGKPDGWAMNTIITDAADVTFDDGGAGSWLGYAITSVGDINSDGYDDFLLGAYMVEYGNDVSGRAYLFLGKPDGWPSLVSPSDADVTFEGSDSERGVARKIAAAGDVNADGRDDFLIGRQGRAYLILGKDSGWSGVINLSTADAFFYATDVYELAPAGDVNHDGFDDILIGADGDDSHGSNTGMTYLVFGKSSGWATYTYLPSAADASYHGTVANDHLGTALASAGDVNNDGFDDILIGTTWPDQYAGRAYLVYGKQSGWTTDVDISTADASFLGANDYDYAGFAMASAGDLNKDGNDDFLISAAYFGPAYTGKVYLFYSDAPVYGDLDRDRDVDGKDLALFANDLNQLDIGKFAQQFGCHNG